MLATVQLPDSFVPFNTVNYWLEAVRQAAAAKFPGTKDDDRERVCVLVIIVPLVVNQISLWENAVSSTAMECNGGKRKKLQLSLQLTMTTTRKGDQRKGNSRESGKSESQIKVAVSQTYTDSL